MSFSWPDVCPTNFTPFGEPLAADMLSNLRLGPDVRNLDYRFRSSQSGAINSVRVYVKTGEGYSGGDGGTMRIDLVVDDPVHEHTPSTQILGSASATGLSRGPFNRAFSFDPAVPVSQGVYYHLVFSNVAVDPNTNFVSINNLVVSGGDISHLTDVAVLTRQDLQTSWYMRSDHIPIIALQYANGDTQGQGYIDALSESGRFTVVGANRIRERFRLLGPDRRFTRVNVRVRNPNSSIADLAVRVEDEDGSVMAEVSIQVAANAIYQWFGSTFPAPVTLKSGQTYNIVLSSKAGVEAFPLQGGARYGFDTPTLFSNGVYEVTTGGGWTSPRRELHMQFYLCG